MGIVLPTKNLAGPVPIYFYTRQFGFWCTMVDMQVAYVDTEGTFRPERIRPIAERFELDPDAVLENVSSLLLAATMPKCQRRCRARTKLHAKGVTCAAHSTSSCSTLLRFGWLLADCGGQSLHA